MKVKEVVAALERFAPLPLQESYDNAGLQVGLTEAETSGVLLCLDVTEPIVREAQEKSCNLIVAHHPLLFRGLKCVSDATFVERCLRAAIKADISVYAAHTNLDNARGGVNFAMAERLGLKNVSFLRQSSVLDGTESGSGVLGELPLPMEPMEFLRQVKAVFGIDCLCHNQGPRCLVRKVALCGGAGGFLADEAAARGAEIFLTGEMGYHHFFGYEERLWMASLGHYQSERFTIDLLYDILTQSCPNLKLLKTEIETNPIHYLYS